MTIRIVIPCLAALALATLVMSGCASTPYGYGDCCGGPVIIIPPAPPDVIIIVQEPPSPRPDHRGDRPEVVRRDPAPRRGPAREGPDRVIRIRQTEPPARGDDRASPAPRKRR